MHRVMVLLNLHSVKFAQAAVLAGSSAALTLTQVMHNINTRLGHIERTLATEPNVLAVKGIQEVVDKHMSFIAGFDRQPIHVDGEIEQDIRVDLGRWIDGMIQFNEYFKVQGDLERARYDFSIMRKPFDELQVRLRDADFSDAIVIEDDDIVEVDSSEHDIYIYEEGDEADLHRVAAGRRHHRAARARYLFPQEVIDLRQYKDRVTVEYLIEKIINPRLALLSEGTHFIIDVEVDRQTLQNMAWALWQRYKLSATAFEDKALILRLSSQGQQCRIYIDSTSSRGNYLTMTPEAIPIPE